MGTIPSTPREQTKESQYYDRIPTPCPVSILGLRYDVYLKGTAMTSRKDYIAIARVIRNAANLPAIINRRVFIGQQLAEHFGYDNPRFNREKFLDACGVEH